MKIKNLEVNKDKLKKIIAGGLGVILLTGISTYSQIKFLKDKEERFPTQETAIVQEDVYTEPEPLPECDLTMHIQEGKNWFFKLDDYSVCTPAYIVVENPNNPEDIVECYTFKPKKPGRTIITFTCTPYDYSLASDYVEYEIIVNEQLEVTVNIGKRYHVERTQEEIDEYLNPVYDDMTEEEMEALDEVYSEENYDSSKQLIKRA